MGAAKVKAMSDMSLELGAGLNADSVRFNNCGFRRHDDSLSAIFKEKKFKRETNFLENGKMGPQKH